jgi:hypothetical protein
LAGRLRRIVVLGVVAAVVLAAPVAASEDPNPPWPNLLPALPISDATQPGPVPHCRVATMRCIEGNLARMQRAVDSFGCDHRGVFATTYLVLTEQVRKTMLADPHFFHDPRWLIYEDTVFANYYFNAVDDYARGRPVPGAWKVAFDNARRGDDNAAQDMLLGINAHVQRDMPFVVASVGLRTPSGATRKPDHDVFNKILNDAYEPVVEAIARRYDPLVSVTNAKWDPLDDVLGMETVKAWRENVWRNAERLVLAKTPAERAAVVAGIESNATAWAHMIADVQVPGYRRYRDAYCTSGGKAPQIAAMPPLRHAPSLSLP